MSDMDSNKVSSWFVWIIAQYSNFAVGTGIQAAMIKSFNSLQKLLNIYFWFLMRIPAVYRL